MRHKVLLIPLACLMLVFFAHRATQSFGFQLDEEASQDTSGKQKPASGGNESTRQLPAHLEGTPNEGGGHSMVEIYLSFGVLVFGAIVLLAEIAVMIRTNNYWDAWSFKVLGLTFVLVSGLFLIVAGYSQDQTAPMMGLLGTVAGYLLGKEGQQPGAEQPVAEEFEEE